MRLIYISLLILSAVASADAKAEDGPKFKGVVTPISSPVSLRYRPFPKSPFTQIKQISIPIDGEEVFNQTQKMSGVMEAQLVEGLIIMTMTSDLALSVGGEAGPFSMKASFSLTQSGQFKGFKKMVLNGKDLLSSASPETNKFLKLMEDAAKSAYSAYDNDNGYVTGDKIIDKDLNMNFMNFDVKLKAHGVVRGLTVHEGRDALVIDFEGTISVEENSGHFGGYMLKDVLTGFTVLDERVMHMPWRLKSELKQLLIKETQTLKLPPMRNKPVQKAGGSIEERLAKLKKLLEKGLLTPEEAAEKRKEILNSL